LFDKNSNAKIRAQYLTKQNRK